MGAGKAERSKAGNNHGFSRKKKQIFVWLSQLRPASKKVQLTFFAALFLKNFFQTGATCDLSLPSNLSAGACPPRDQDEKFVDTFELNIKHK